MPRCALCGVENHDGARSCIECGKELLDQPSGTGQLPQGSVLAGRYVITTLLGTGGMAAIYKASDVRIPGKAWAIKELSDAAIENAAEKEAAHTAFLQEAQMLATLDHPNLAKVSDFFSQEGKLYLVMDFIDGQNLESMLDKLRPSGFVEERKIVEWAVQILDVLSYLHSRTPAVIFRDLKPSNIMLDREDRIKLIDFGIARLFKPGKSRDTQQYGTPGYAPPEQYGQSQTDLRSDIYALGVTLHHLATLYDPALAPFRLPPVRSINPDVSANLEITIQVATQLDPEDRFQSTDEMKKTLLGSISHPDKSLLSEATYRTHPWASLLHRLIAGRRGDTEVTVTGSLTVPVSRPILRLDKDLLNFGSMQAGKSKRLSFEAESKTRWPLQGEMRSSHTWVTIPSQFKIRGGSRITIPVHIRTKGLTPGHHVARVSVTSSGGDAAITVKVYVIGLSQVPTTEIEIPLLANPTKRLEATLFGREDVVDKLATWIAELPNGCLRTFLLTGYGSFGGTSIVKMAIDRARHDPKLGTAKKDRPHSILTATLNFDRVPPGELTLPRLLKLLAWELHAEIRAGKYATEWQKEIETFIQHQQDLPRRETAVTKTSEEGTGLASEISVPPAVKVPGIEVGPMIRGTIGPKKGLSNQSVTCEYERTADVDATYMEFREFVDRLTSGQLVQAGGPTRRKTEHIRRLVLVIDKVKTLEEMDALRTMIGFPGVSYVFIVDGEQYDRWKTQMGSDQQFARRYNIDDITRLENLPAGAVEDICAAIIDDSQASSEDYEQLEIFLGGTIVEASGAVGEIVRKLKGHLQPRHRRRWGRQTTQWTLKFPRPGSEARRIAHLQNVIYRADSWFIPETLNEEERERVRSGLYSLVRWITNYEKASPAQFTVQQIQDAAGSLFPPIIITGTRAETDILSGVKRKEIVDGFLQSLVNKGYLYRQNDHYSINTDWNPRIG